jgi:hypothetical protein
MLKLRAEEWSANAVLITATSAYFFPREVSFCEVELEAFPSSIEQPFRGRARGSTYYTGTGTSYTETGTSPVVAGVSTHDGVSLTNAAIGTGNNRTR